MNLIEKFLNNIESSNIIITNSDFFNSIGYILQDLLNINNENLFFKISNKSIAISNNMYEKAKLKAEQMTINTDFDQQYKELCIEFFEKCKKNPKEKI
jgi:hypothetical protein